MGTAHSFKNAILSFPDFAALHPGYIDGAVVEG